MGDLRSIPGLGQSPGEGQGYPLQYSGLENILHCIVHGVAKNWTGPSDFHFHREKRGCLAWNRKDPREMLTSAVKFVKVC